MRLLFAAFALLVLAAAGAVLTARRNVDARPTSIAASIDGVHFSYPAAYARDGATRMGGALDRLAFLTVFPDFAPAPAASPDPQRRDAQALDPTLVFIAIAPRDETIDPAERPSHLYARFLESEVFAAPGGLMLRRFEAGSPYELEQLYLAPPDGAVFFARCPKREAGFMGAAACIWALRRDNLDVEVRFAPALLEHWSRIVEGTRGYLRSIDARLERPAPRQ